MLGNDLRRTNAEETAAGLRYNRPVARSIKHQTMQLPADYPEFLAEVKTRIAAARTRATLAVNSELIKLYRDIGHDILDREQREGWGAKVIDRLAADLRRDFPETTGFSRSNLHYMRQLAAAWPEEEVVPRVVGQLPWGHIRCLFDKLDGPAPRLWYAAKAVENGWSRKVLASRSRWNASSSVPSGPTFFARFFSMRSPKRALLLRFCI